MARVTQPHRAVGGAIVLRRTSHRSESLRCSSGVRKLLTLGTARAPARFRSRVTASSTLCATLKCFANPALAGFPASGALALLGPLRPRKGSLPHACNSAWFLATRSTFLGAAAAATAAAEGRMTLVPGMVSTREVSRNDVRAPPEGPATPAVCGRGRIAGASPGPWGDSASRLASSTASWGTRLAAPWDRKGEATGLLPAALRRSGRSALPGASLVPGPEARAARDARRSRVLRDSVAACLAARAGPWATSYGSSSVSLYRKEWLRLRSPRLPEMLMLESEPEVSKSRRARDAFPEPSALSSAPPVEGCARSGRAGSSSTRELSRTMCSKRISCSSRRMTPSSASACPIPRSCCRSSERVRNGAIEV